uniref:Uncharacterized protein n=1 Tax=Juglanconis juglandina TaxID=1940567 RepID=A0A291LJE9_9PEZI|nr:hypothetical protein [Juglanconis juglandina]
MSLIGRLTHFTIGKGFRLSSFMMLDFHSTIPLSTNFLVNLAMGIVSLKEVVGTLWEWPLKFLNLLISPLTLDVRWMSVPKKCALPSAALVTSVFSNDSSSFSSFSMKMAIFCLRLWANSADPAIPISQSSAYLT